jgi:site-specific recombinase XerD
VRTTHNGWIDTRNRFDLGPFVIYQWLRRRGTVSEPTYTNRLTRARSRLEGHGFLRLFDDCFKEFARYGYSQRTIEDHFAGITHFLYWFKRRGGTVSQINVRATQRFIRSHLLRCHCASHCARKRPRVQRAINALLQVLRKQARLLDSPALIPGTVAAELIAYDLHLKDVCGFTHQTRRNYLWGAKHFLSRRFGNRKIRNSMLTPEAIRAFINEVSPRRSSLSAIVSQLRSYFRFKAVGGMQVTALLAALPKVAHWRLAKLPKTLTSSEIDKFLKSFDRTTKSGGRDYAMGRCLVDLGLRANEAARLQLDDIDWRAGTVQIRGKGQRVQLLPLPQKLGHALAEYIRKFRPTTTSRAVFMQLEAPVAEATARVVGRAMGRAAERCGLRHKMKGTHVLRHSIAGRLLSRGATLKGIADVLRHRSFDTTRIYAKVDLSSLKRVAMPWAGRAA